MTQVLFTFVHPDGTPLADTEFSVQLRKSGIDHQGDSLVVPQTYTFVTNAEGTALLELQPSSSVYTMVMLRDSDQCGGIRYKFYVPYSAEVVRAEDLYLAPAPNSEPWDETAIRELTEAKIVAVNAAETATDAATRAEAAAEGAGDFAERAEAARGEAVTAATEARGSADSAELSATTAVASETSAEQSAATALASKDAAAVTANASAQSAAEALASKNAAVTSSTSATASAGTATTKAAEASASASTATTKAGIATTQAGIATTQANRAKTEADNAAASAANKASSGANSDITSLRGLTTPLSVTQGGTGGANAASARAGLGLGSASTANIGTTPGQVMNVGTGGFYGSPGNVPITNNLYDNNQRSLEMVQYAPTVNGERILGAQSDFGLALSLQGAAYEWRHILQFTTDGDVYDVSITNPSQGGQWRVAKFYTSLNTTKAADGTLKAI